MISEIIDITEAEARADELLDRVVAGETIIITKGGKPGAKLMPYDCADELPSQYSEGQSSLDTAKPE